MYYLEEEIGIIGIKDDLWKQNEFCRKVYFEIVKFV